MTAIQKSLAGGALVLVALFSWANWPCKAVPKGERADRVVVFKSVRRMWLVDGNRVLRRYQISLGAQPVGHKRCEGDERTPEGTYVLDWRNPHSVAHLSLHVSYPDDRDRESAAAAGCDAGGMIMVHGIRNGLGWVGRMHRWWDWTDGCIALTNPEMTEFWRVVPDGTTIDIRP